MSKPENNGQGKLDFCCPSSGALDAELINAHPAALVPPVPDVRDRTTPLYREHFERFCEDVKANGVRQPILAYRQADLYPIIDGETRRLAALYAALASVPVLVLRAKPEGAALKVAMLQANAMRADMSDLDYAKIYAELMRENGWNQARLIRELNHQQPVVCKRLKVIKHLPDDLKARLGEAEGQLPFSVAYLLARAFEKLGDDAADVQAEDERREAEAAFRHVDLTPRRLARRVLHGLRATRDEVEEDVASLLGAGRPERPKPLALEAAGAKVRFEDGSYECVKAAVEAVAAGIKAFDKGKHPKEDFRALIAALLK